ncbi:helix-turn-helix domain-containing protein [Acutalibacter sp.]|jgi:transcriptional regulator with XRE-family HTH domain|uniref:helix-turn-helix domain-containing protein n=1 Tax=Acutalibacter sp. TaxID=1918636 RepID=UPI00217362E9|nr:helix-turn-helix transcriptional regulator [Acutalibacter sp.]
MDFEKIIKENLRTVIRQRGVTQGWLAEKADTTEATVSRYLTGVHSPRIELIARMARALNVSVDYLLGLSESSIPNQPPTPEMRAVISSYSRASTFTKKMVWMQLEPAMTEDEKSAMPEFIDTPPASEEHDSDNEQDSDDEQV